MKFKIFPKLILVNDEDTVPIQAYCRSTREWYFLPVKGEKFRAGIGKNALYLNMDQIREIYNFLRTPQLFLHEFAHWYFPTIEITDLIHKIHFKLKGLLI